MQRGYGRRPRGLKIKGISSITQIFTIQSDFYLFFSSMKIKLLSKRLLIGILWIIFLGGSLTPQYTRANQKKGFWQNTYVSEIGVPGTQNADNTGASLLTSIKKFINWALGMLATVALVICLYAGFKMMTAGGDDGRFKDGKDMIKKAASFIMWIIGNLTEDKNGTTISETT